MVQLLSAMNGTCDVLVIGGGIVGLAIALELRSRGLTVTVLNRNTQEAATWAAAGMLAPESEGIPPGPMLDLCLQSRALYPAWVQQLEDKTDLVAGYWPCGVLVPDFVAPVPANGNGGYPQPRSNGLQDTMFWRQGLGCGNSCLYQWFPAKGKCVVCGGPIPLRPWIESCLDLLPIWCPGGMAELLLGPPPKMWALPPTTRQQAYKLCYNGPYASGLPYRTTPLRVFGGASGLPPPMSYLSWDPATVLI